MNNNRMRFTGTAAVGRRERGKLRFRMMSVVGLGGGSYQCKMVGNFHSSFNLQLLRQLPAASATPLRLLFSDLY